MKRLILLAALLCCQSFAAKPNILFIAIDDQNDWIGHLGGHPLAKTPRMPTKNGRIPTRARPR